MMEIVKALRTEIDRLSACIAGVGAAARPWWDQVPSDVNHWQGRLRRCGCRKSANCDHCGGTGVRRECHQRDCQEYGCSFGFCAVSLEEADRYLAECPFIEHS